MKRKYGKIAGSVAVIVFTALVLTLTVGASLLPIAANAITRQTVNWGWERESYDGTVVYYARECATFGEARARSREIAERVQAEGSVLLENDGALPLEAGERRVTVFGSASVNIAVGGTGSGEGSRENTVELYAALADAGFAVNPDVESFYVRKKKEGYKRGRGTDMNGAYYGKRGARDYGYSVNEPGRALYEPVRASYADYNDAAIVVIGRSGGEGQDLPTSMRGFYEDDDKHYLELTDEEYDLLAEARDGGFGKIVVLLNTLNAFELGFLKDPAYGINAALWIGGTGNYGMTAVAGLLTGEREPSGRLPDTYAADLLCAPAMQNYGDNRFTENGRATTAAYVSYSESIYVGYRYYETRFADVTTGRPNAGEFDYESEVVYPFGYGLGYTAFEWSDFTLTEKEGALTAAVTVTNTGSRAGRDVVQLYANKPYTVYDAENRVEKPFVELVAYAKTPRLGPRESATVTASFSRRALASYDGNNAKTYLLEAGEYYITAAENAHAAALNVLAAADAGEKDSVKIYEVGRTETMDESATGYEITNRFETDNYTSALPDVTYLTRADWTGTFPSVYGDGGDAGKATKALDARTKAAILARGENAHLGCNNDGYDYVYNNGLCTYATEQTIREVYLRTFEFAVTEGGAHGVMTSYNRIGETWAGGHHGLLTEVLRNEWGMEGNALTDYAGTFGYEYMNMNQGLRAGGDVWLYPQDAFPRTETNTDAAVYYMQKAAKHILFAEANSSRINGLRRLDGSVMQCGEPIFKWQIVFAVADVNVVIIAIVSVYLLLKTNKHKQIKPV